MGLLDRFIYLSLGPSVIRVFIGGRLIVTFLHQLDPAIPHVRAYRDVVNGDCRRLGRHHGRQRPRRPSRPRPAAYGPPAGPGSPKPPASPAGRSAPRTLGRITRTGRLTRSDWHIHQERLRDRPPGPHSCSRCARRSFPVGVAPCPSGRRRRLRNQASGLPAARVAGLGGSDGSGEGAGPGGAAASEGVALPSAGRLLACGGGRVCSSRMCQSSSLLVRYHRPQVRHCIGMTASFPAAPGPRSCGCRLHEDAGSGAATGRAAVGRSGACWLPSAGNLPAAEPSRGHSIGAIGVAGQSSSRAPSTAASRVNRWAGSVAA
jgi:hypothetical protein